MVDATRFIEDPCTCRVCVQLSRCYVITSQAVQAADRESLSFLALLKAATANGEAVQALHRDHKPLSYVDEDESSVSTVTPAKVGISIGARADVKTDLLDSLNMDITYLRQTRK